MKYSKFLDNAIFKINILKLLVSEKRKREFFENFYDFLRKLQYFIFFTVYKCP